MSWLFDRLKKALEEAIETEKLNSKKKTKKKQTNKKGVA